MSLVLPEPKIADCCDENVQGPAVPVLSLNRAGVGLAAPRTWAPAALGIDWHSLLGRPVEE